MKSKHVEVNSYVNEQNLKMLDSIIKKNLKNLFLFKDTTCIQIYCWLRIFTYPFIFW